MKTEALRGADVPESHRMTSMCDVTPDNPKLRSEGEESAHQGIGSRQRIPHGTERLRGPGFEAW